MAQRVADQLVQTLVAAGVERIWGIVGDSLNGFTEAMRTSSIRWMHVRHEEVAAFAAGAEAEMTGKLAVCAGSCGPGNLHLINGLFDCHRNRVPVLAIAAQIPSRRDRQQLFPGDASVDPVPRMQPLLRADLAAGADAARAGDRDAHGDRQARRSGHRPPRRRRPARSRPSTRRTGPMPHAPIVLPPTGEIGKLAEVLNGVDRVTHALRRRMRRCARPGARARRPRSRRRSSTRCAARNISSTTIRTTSA